MFTNPGTPTKDNYLFIKWVDEATGLDFDFSVAPQANITLKAIFKFLLDEVNAATVDTIINALQDTLLGLDLSKINDENREYIKQEVIAKRPSDGFKTVQELQVAFNLIVQNYTRAKEIDDKAVQITANHQQAKQANDGSQINDNLITELKTLIDNYHEFITKTVNGLILDDINPSLMLVEYNKLDDPRKLQLKTIVITKDITTISKIIIAYTEIIPTLKTPQEKIAEELNALSLPSEIAPDTESIDIILNGKTYPSLVFSYQTSDPAVCTVEGGVLKFVHSASEDKQVTITVTATLESVVDTKQFVINVLQKPEFTESVITRKQKNNKPYNGSIVSNLNITNNLKNSIEVIYKPATSLTTIFNNKHGIRLYQNDELTIKVDKAKIYKIELTTDKTYSYLVNGTQVNKKKTITIEFTDGVDEVIIKADKNNKPTFTQFKIIYK